MAALMLLVGLHMAVESAADAALKAIRAVEWELAAGIGKVRLRLALMGEWVRFQRSNFAEWRRARRDRKVGPLLDKEAMAAWLEAPRDWREITGDQIPRIRDDRPVPALKPTAAFEVIELPAHVRTAAETWVDEPTHAVPTWEAQAAMPTALVTRQRVPAEEIATHCCLDGSRSYLGPEYTPNYVPRHAADDETEEHDA